MCKDGKLTPHNQLLRVDGVRKPRKTFRLEEGKPRCIAIISKRQKNLSVAPKAVVVNIDDFPATPTAKTS